MNFFDYLKVVRILVFLQLLIVILNGGIFRRGIFFSGWLANIFSTFRFLTISLLLKY